MLIKITYNTLPFDGWGTHIDDVDHIKAISGERERRRKVNDGDKSMERIRGEYRSKSNQQQQHHPRFVKASANNKTRIYLFVPTHNSIFSRVEKRLQLHVVGFRTIISSLCKHSTHT